MVDILIDADPLVYRVGFSLEQRVYYVSYRDVDPEYLDEPLWDQEHTAKFWNAKSRDQYIEWQNLHPDEYTSVLSSIPTADEAVVFGRVKQSIKDIEHHVGAYLYEHSQTVGPIRVFLSGTENFRNEIATIKKYKGSRDRSTRPFWYTAIREYLIQYWGAEVSEGIEADDVVSIEQHSKGNFETIIATIDKDLLNVPGHHYNYMTKQARTVSSKEAALFFYRQLLMGDPTDDIQGCFKVGEGKALKLLPEWMPERKMYIIVLQEYERNMMTYPEKHGTYTEAADSLLENARLLWMMTTYDDLWNPPGTPNGSLKGHLENLPPGDPDEDLT